MDTAHVDYLRDSNRHRDTRIAETVQPLRTGGVCEVEVPLLDYRGAMSPVIGPSGPIRQVRRRRRLSVSAHQRDGAEVPVPMSVSQAHEQLDTPNISTPCRANPAGWDTDLTGEDGLRAAVRACRLDCPLFEACRTVARSGSVICQAMVWAAVVYDERGRVVDLDGTRLRVGGYATRDTRIPDSAGRIFNGHNGRWEPPT